MTSALILKCLYHPQFGILCKAWIINIFLWKASSSSGVVEQYANFWPRSNLNEMKKILIRRSIEVISDFAKLSPLLKALQTNMALSTSFNPKCLCDPLIWIIIYAKLLSYDSSIWLSYNCILSNVHDKVVLSTFLHIWAQTFLRKHNWFH